MSFSFLPFAHALASRQDLPVPAWLFAWAASIVLIVSFFALSVAWRAPRFEEEGWRPLGAGLSRVLLGLPAQIAVRGDRRLPARGRRLRRAAGHRSPRPQLRADLHLRHLLARVSAVQRPDRQRLPAVQPLAGGRASGRRDVLGDRRTAAGAPALSRSGRPLAGRDRADGVRLARGDLRRQRRRRGRAQPACHRRRDPRLQRSTRW